MAVDYSVGVCRRLQRRFAECRLVRPMRFDRYDAGDELEYEVVPVEAAGDPCRVKLVVERFVGGGFAGQVYKVRIVESAGALQSTLPAGGSFALKILVPPSGGARLFRNLLYAIGFQGAFQPQTNPVAARAGAIWQKFIRRAASVVFGDRTCVNDVHGTFVDRRVGSCGEISDWIDGRIWRLEVDDRVDLLRQWSKGRPVDRSALGSPEFRSKKKFMADFVRLLDEMGAPEFARQYEWSTWKSQPNCLKRLDSEDDPSAGLIAVDFRAGLALLPFLPMSPGDFVLIFKGLARGSLVQFDRGNLEKLAAYVQRHAAEFAGMQELFAELERTEAIYRDSLIDVTHNHVRLLYSDRLWKRILESAVTGWRVSGTLDERHAAAMRGRVFRIAIFAALGLIPFVGRLARRIWGRDDYRAHYRSILSSLAYLRRAVSGKMAERVAAWHRAGRVMEHRAEKVASSMPSYLAHQFVSWLSVGMHRMATDAAFLKERLHHFTIRPVKLYFDAGMREQWLRDMIREGQRKKIVTDEDAETIHSHIGEPFIQKYLKSLAVHVCTVPVTQVVSLIVAGLYIWTHPDLPRAQAWATGVGIVALFQVVPISPGSLVRGLYVVFLALRERNFKDYNIAVFLGFFKYVGYLAFPIQMARRYPTLARFMAAHWATDAVHIVPVFGEHGALFEHKAFTLFYNVPLTLRARMQRRSALRATRRPRRWHLLPLAIGAAGLLWGVQQWIAVGAGQLPTLREIWWCTLAVPLLCGAYYTLLAGGAVLGRRMVGAVLCGIAAGAFYSLFAYASAGSGLSLGSLAATAVWHMFILGVLSPIGAILTEVTLPEP